MIENCHHEINVELNFNITPCCLKHLLIMNHISEEYLLSDKFSKYILRSFKNIFEKDKTFIKSNNKPNNNIFNDFFSMVSKHMSHFYFINKTNLAKYLCKIAFNYFTQELSNNKLKSKDINIIKSNLCCIYSREQRYDKAFNIIKDISNFNTNTFTNDNLICLNNYIYLYIKFKKKIDKEIISKINILKTNINHKLNQIIQISKISESNKSLLINKNKKDINIAEINLYLFIYFNYCNVYSKINNSNHSNNLSNYKKGYELCLIYLGENHHLSIKYKTIINKLVLNKSHNKKIIMNKNEINSKLNEINNRLDKIGKSILPVKKIISNYRQNKINIEEKKSYFSHKNSRTEIYSKDIIRIKDIENKKEEEKNDYENENDNDNDTDNKEETQIKIEMPKIVIKLNEDNNDELICNTLYEEVDNNEKENTNLNEEKKEEIPKVSFPTININLDNTNNDDYTCETFFIPADDTDNNKPKENSKDNQLNNQELLNNEIQKISFPTININLDNANNDDYTCETFFIPADETDNNKPKENNNNKNNSFSLSFKIPEEQKENSLNKNINISNDNKLTNQELLNKYFKDLKFYHEPFINNSYLEKNELFDISNFLTELKEKKINIDSNKFDYKLRFSNKSNLLIKLEVLSNFNIRLLLINKDNDNEEILSTQYSFKKLIGLYKIIRYDLCLLLEQSYFDFNSYSEYISKTFLNFITINKENDQYKFKMAKKPLGLCHSSVVITLYFSKVVFDIMAIKKNFCKIILSSENNDYNSMVLDTYFDEESFNMLINIEVIENKYEIYSLKNNDLNNNEMLLEIIKNLQKVINGFCSGIVNVFDDLYIKANSNQKKIKELLVFKLDINNQLKNMKLFVCQFDNKLCKIITIDQNLTKVKGIIYRHEIADLFGYETSNIWNKLISYQKLKFAQIILNAAIYKEENSIMSIDKYQILDEINFVYQKKICNFCLIKLKNFIYIKFMLYESIGTFEFTKIIFIKNKKNNLDKIKLKDIKDKLLLAVNKSIENINNGDDSLFSEINIDENI